MTSESNNGRPPAPRAGARPANGNGRAKDTANQGDLWSDAPAKPAASPVPEARRPLEQPAVPAFPPSPVSEDLDEEDVVEPTGDNALDELELDEDDAPSIPGAVAVTDVDDVLDSRPNLLETALPLPPSVEPDLEEQYEDEEYEDDYGEGYYYRDDQMSLLRNPYVLAGLAVALAIVMAVAVVFLFGRSGSGEGGNGGNNNGGGAVQTQTPRPGGNAIPGAVNAKSIAQATVREGPDREYLELGLLRADQDVQVVGRNADTSWYQIVFPRDSQLRGWVPKTALSVPDSALASLAVVTVTPIDRPTVAIPTSTPRPAEPTATPEPTTTANDRADIAVVIAADCTPNSAIVLSINNVGNVPIDHTVQVIVSNNGLVEYDKAFQAKIAPGQSVPLNTGVQAKAPSMTATVLLQGLQDVSAVNNIASCSVSGGGGNNGGNNNNGGTNVPPPITTPAN